MNGASRTCMTGMLLGITLLLLAPAAAFPQGKTFIPTTSAKPPEPEEEKPLGINESNVGVIDSALPRTMMRLRFDAGFHITQPARAETYFAKPGVLGGRGLGPIEKNLVYHDFSLYGEYALVPEFSTFVEVPYRFLNPDINPNTRGPGDANFGIKLCTWSDEKFIATFQFRVFNPTSVNPGLGVEHWTAEPALLASWKVYDKFLLEGEFRYWAPLTSDDFAGDMLRYGIGLSYGQRTDTFWFAPVIEGVGWTIMSGKTVVYHSETSYTVKDNNHQTIFNGYVGLRAGYGQHLDFYLGYGRSFTGDFFTRDFARFEMRLMY